MLFLTRLSALTLGLSLALSGCQTTTPESLPPAASAAAGTASAGSATAPTATGAGAETTVAGRLPSDTDGPLGDDLLMSAEDSRCLEMRAVLRQYKIRLELAKGYVGATSRDSFNAYHYWLVGSFSPGAAIAGTLFAALLQELDEAGSSVATRGNYERTKPLYDNANEVYRQEGCAETLGAFEARWSYRWARAERWTGTVNAETQFSAAPSEANSCAGRDLKLELGIDETLVLGRLRLPRDIGSAGTAAATVYLQGRYDRAFETLDAVAIGSGEPVFELKGGKDKGRWSRGACSGTYALAKTAMANPALPKTPPLTAARDGQTWEGHWSGVATSGAASGGACPARIPLDLRASDGLLVGRFGTGDIRTGRVDQAGWLHNVTAVANNEKFVLTGNLAKGLWRNEATGCAGEFELKQGQT